MILKTMKNTFDGMRGENQFLRLALAGALVANVVTSCAVMNREEIVSIVPPTLTEHAWVSKSTASAEYIESWAFFVASLIGNVTPHNATVVKDALGPLLDQDIYQNVMSVLDQQIHQIRQDRVTLAFEPEKVLRDNTNPNKLYVTGRSVSEGPSGGKKRVSRTYELELTIKNYKPVITWVSTNTGDARTADVVAREDAKAARIAEREKRQKD